MKMYQFSLICKSILMTTHNKHLSRTNKKKKTSKKHCLSGLTLAMLNILFVCVEIYQPKRVMSNAVSLHNHTFTGQA